MYLENMFLDWEWWQLCLVALLVFLAFLFTNYILKKINEARIEERCARLAQGQATSQGTQYEGLGLNSFKIKTIIPTEENKQAMTILRKEISLTSKDDNYYQDHRTQKEASISKSDNTGGLKEVVERNVTTLPCAVRKKLEKPTDLTIETETIKDNNIRNTSKHILANIVFPISEILQNSEVTASTEGIAHQFKEKITENVLSLTNDVEVKNCQSNCRDFKILDIPDDKIYQKIIDNSSLQSNEVVTNIVEAITNEFSEISQETEEPIFEIESAREKIKHTEPETLPETSKKISKSPLLSREVLPQEKNLTTKKSDILKMEQSQVAVERLSQKTSISSLIKSLSSVKPTNTQESTPQSDFKKDDNQTTTVGLVMLDVSQKVGNSLFHNTNSFINENKQKVTNVANANSNAIETENYFALKSTNLNANNSDTNNVTLAKDVTVEITSSDADPQTSKLKKKPRKKLPASSGYSSKAKYTRNLKSFWEIFLNHRRS